MALYAALPDEVPTQGLMRALIERGQTVLLPRATDENRLVFVVVHDLPLLAPGAFGALEPPAAAPATRLEPDDLVLVPGVAFDLWGGRLGRGGGWYDRSLPPGVDELFGIAFELQLVDRVPTTATDRRMRGVFTERGFHDCELQAGPREALGDPS